MNLLRKSILAVALGAATLASASPALADGWRGGHRRDGGDDTAIAIGAGVVGLALGAAIASSSRDRDYYRDDYYYDRGPQYREYYYYREGPRYPGRYYRPHYRGHDRGYYGGRGRDWRGHRGHGHGW